MPLPGMSFPIWRIMNVVAISACVLGIASGFSNRANTSGGLITILLCTFLFPILLIVGRRVPLGTVRDVLRISALIGLPLSLLFGLLALMTGGAVPFLGASLSMLLMFVWFSLFIAAFQSTRPPEPNPDRPSDIEYLPSDVPENASERH